MKKKIILIYIFILFCNVYSKEFIKGADISLLIEMEKAGQKYYDEKGKEKDCIKILNKNGIEWIRIRVWNKPYDVYWSDRVSTNKQKVNGNIGGGTNDINKAITLAKRAKQYNMKVLLDFHYSDFWADPGKQYKPDDWIGLKGVQLEKALYEYTKNSLIKMAKNNVLPDMVQIGNEINNGFIWRDGKDISSKEFINLLNSGIKAVKEVEKLYNKKIKIMLHLAFENDFSKLEYLLNRFKDNNLDYDILGLSYYPYWHGEMKNLYNNMLKIKNNYNKNVIIVETA
ncbi:MAG: Arabinogalactan endo,4-beta-galactosidase [Fusobacteriales bacterium]|jgi:arabinogalactan endo-1,4-beta-galactosidase|nr:Arabinogalactan endo,4-beta-galactosidase [Fusobacteriales bacterium]